MSISTEQLEAIRKRLKAASHGPWTVGQRWEDEDTEMANWLPVNRPAVDPEDPHQPERVALIRYWPGPFQFPHVDAHNDAEFIAGARQDIPLLLAEVERLRPLAESALALHKAISEADHVGIQVTDMAVWREMEQLCEAAHEDAALLPEEILNAKVKFWICRDHRGGIVEWRGDVAHCLEPGCGKKSDPAASSPSTEEQTS